MIEPGDIVSFKLDSKGDSKEFVTKNINILDPIISKNNIGLSVSKISAIRIKNTFERVNEYLKQFTNVKDQEEFNQDQLHKLLYLFQNMTRVNQSIRNQELLIMSTLKHGQEFDLGYEVGKIGSSGVR